MLQRYLKDKRGNFSIIMAVLFGVIALGIAVALEISRAQSLKSYLRDSLDTATLYAAQNIEEDSFKEDSVRYFDSNFTTAQAVNVISVDFNVDEDEVIGTASIDMPLTFGALLNKDKIDISARSVVKIAEETTSPCIMALSQTRQPGLLLNGGANITAPNCEVHVHSVQSPAYTVNSNTTLDVTKVCVAGSTILNPSNVPTPTLETNCPTISDPYRGVFPEPDSSSCDYNSNVYTDANIYLSPGVYCGSHNFQGPNSTVNFAPGIYILKGGHWTVDGGTWNGDGITFYYSDNSHVQFNSAVKANMTAPTSGPYKGLFMTEAPSVPNLGAQWVLDDSRGFEFEGVIYLPTRQVVFNGNANLTSRKIDIVADSLIINTVNIELEPVNGSNNSGSIYLSE